MANGIGSSLILFMDYLIADQVSFSVWLLIYIIDHIKNVCSESLFTFNW